MKVIEKKGISIALHFFHIAIIFSNQDKHTDGLSMIITRVSNLWTLSNQDFKKQGTLGNAEDVMRNFHGICRWPEILGARTFIFYLIFSCITRP